MSGYGHMYKLNAIVDCCVHAQVCVIEFCAVSDSRFECPPKMDNHLGQHTHGVCRFGHHSVLRIHVHARIQTMRTHTSPPPTRIATPSPSLTGNDACRAKY